MRPARILLLAAVLVLAPLGDRAADEAIASIKQALGE